MFKNLCNCLLAYSDNLMFNDVDIHMYNLCIYFSSKYLNLKAVFNCMACLLLLRCHPKKYNTMHITYNSYFIIIKSISTIK